MDIHILGIEVHHWGHQTPYLIFYTYKYECLGSVKGEEKGCSWRNCLQLGKQPALGRDDVSKLVRLSVSVIVQVYCSCVIENKLLHIFIGLR